MLYCTLALASQASLIFAPATAAAAAASTELTSGPASTLPTLRSTPLLFLVLSLATPATGVTSAVGAACRQRRFHSKTGGHSCCQDSRCQCHTTLHSTRASEGCPAHPALPFRAQRTSVESGDPGAEERLLERAPRGVRMPNACLTARPNAGEGRGKCTRRTCTRGMPRSAHGKAGVLRGTGAHVSGHRAADVETHLAHGRRRVALLERLCRSAPAPDLCRQRRGLLAPRLLRHPARLGDHARHRFGDRLCGNLQGGRGPRDESAHCQGSKHQSKGPVRIHCSAHRSPLDAHCRGTLTSARATLGASASGDGVEEAPPGGSSRRRLSHSTSPMRMPPASCDAQRRPGAGSRGFPTIQPTSGSRATPWQVLGGRARSLHLPVGAVRAVAHLGLLERPEPPP